MQGTMIASLLILLFTMVSYTVRKINMGTTAMIATVLLILTGCISGEEALSNFGNANGIMMCAMFVVAAGFNRTQLVNNLSKLLYRVSKGNFRIMLAGYIVITFLLGQFIGSSIVILTIVLPLVASSCEEFDISPSRAIFPVGLVGITCLGSLPIGTNLVQYARNNGYLETYGYTTYQFKILDQCIARLPLTIVILIVAIFISPMLTPKESALPITTTESKQQRKKESLDPLREKLAYIIFLGVSIALVFQSRLGIESWVIALIGSLLVGVTGVLSSKEVNDAIPVDMYLLYVGGLCIGTGLVNTGAGDLIGNLVVKIIGDNRNGYLLGAIFFLIPFIMTQFMNNRTVPNICIPICILACKSLGANPVGPLLLTTNASLTSYMTPMATPSVPVVMGMGGYDMKQMIKQGIIPAMIIFAFSVFYTMTVFPAYP